MCQARFLLLPLFFVLISQPIHAQHGIELTRPNPQADDLFGATVANDHSRLAVGARGTAGDSGAVHIYVSDNQGWRLEQSLTTPTAEIGSRFGDGLALDGTTLFVGASTADVSGLTAGRVFVYEQTDGVWEHVQTLEDSEPEEEAWFGVSCSIDGDVAAVGSREDPDGVNRSGSVFVYRRGQDGLWAQEAKLRAETPKPFGFFGHAIEIEGDRLVVGSIIGTGGVFESGAVRVFDRVDEKWMQTTKLIPDTPQRFEDYFGIDVSLDGDLILVGARKVNMPGAIDGGAAYLFKLNGTEWVHSDTILPSLPEPSGEFGNKVSLSDGFAIIGSWFATHNGVRGGACEIFRVRDGVATNIKIIYPDTPTQFGSLGHDVAIVNDLLLLAAYEDGGYGSESGKVWVLPINGCRADTNADGVLSPTDFNAWIGAYRQESSDCDQDGDGECTPADFNSWLQNYRDGC